MSEKNELQVIKTDRFGGIEYEIYSDSKEMYMTSEQLGECLNFANGRKGIDNIISRNEYLSSPEFSVTLKLRATDGKHYNTRVFTEDGVYEVTMLAKTEVAKKFRAQIRTVLKSIRSGKATVIQTDRLSEIKIRASADRAAAMKMNAENRRLKLLLEHPHLQDLSPIAKQVFALKSIEDTTGTPISNVLPECGELYGAGQLAEKWTKEFGVKVTANMLGKLANAYGLKDDKHGIVAMDKSPHSSKEIPSFRYNRKGADELKVLAMAHYGIKIQ